jgi:hypothetical protein
LKLIDSIKRDYPEDNSLMQKAYNLSLKIKTNIILFLKKSFSEKPENPQFLPFVQTLAKNLDISSKNSAKIQ